MAATLLELLQIYPIYQSICSFLTLGDFLRLRRTNSHIRTVCQPLSKVTLTTPENQDHVVESWLRIWAYERCDTIASSSDVPRVYPPDQTWIARVKAPYLAMERFTGITMRHSLMSIGCAFETITHIILDKTPTSELAIIYTLEKMRNLEFLSLRGCSTVTVTEVARFIALNTPPKLKEVRIWNMGEIPRVIHGDLPASSMDLEPMKSIAGLAKICGVDTGICQECSPHRNRFMPCELRAMTCDSCNTTQKVERCPDCLIPYVCEACQKYYCRDCVPWHVSSQEKREAHEKELWRMRFSDSRLRLNFITSDRSCSSYKILKQSGAGVVIECGTASCFWHAWRHYFHKRCFPSFMAQNRFCDFCDLWLCPSAPSEFPVRCLLCKRNACHDCESGRCGACLMGTCKTHEYSSRRCGGLDDRGCNWGVCFECMNKGAGRKFDDMEGVIVWWNKEDNLCGTCYEEKQRSEDMTEASNTGTQSSAVSSPARTERTLVRVDRR